jgi:hypothetical protein
MAALEDAVSRAEREARTKVVRDRVRLIRTRVDFTKRTMHYLATVQSPFKGIDLNNTEAVAAAHKKAIELGEPLSEELKAFCQTNDLQAYPRLVDVHNSLHFIVDLPNRRRVLQ